MKVVTRYPTLKLASLQGLFPRLSVVVVLLVLLPACVTEVPVTRHSGVALDDPTAQQILRDFTEVISLSDSPGDFACASDYGPDFYPAIYLKDDPVGVHNGPAVINSAADFSALLAEPGYAKVVEEINWCSGFSPNIVGCAPISGNSFAVVRVGSQVEGILWAHEFGHTVGLGHRSSNTAVMKGSLNTNRREITEEECESFVEKHNADWPNPPADGAAIVEAALPQGMTLEENLDGSLEGEPAGSSDVLSFVRTLYPHGTPMGDVLQFENTDAVPQLLAMLQHENEEPYWGNIVAVLGMIGDVTVAPDLIAFAQQQAGLQSGSGPRNISAALMGLGYLANRTGDPQVLNYLAAAGSSSHWQAAPERASQLAISARIGMAFSGHRMPATRSSSTLDEMPPELSAELEALRNEVASVGVASYYRNR